MRTNISLMSSYIATPLGEMVVISDKKSLYFLEFANNPHLEHKIRRLCSHTHATVALGESIPIISIKEELDMYFDKKMTENFKTPLSLSGTDFQKSVWSQLLHIPYGHTQSYLEIAKALHKKKAYRAVANANGANLINIIIPCHRVIQHNGEIGGYNGGVPRKKWLLGHENTRWFKKK